MKYFSNLTPKQKDETHRKVCELLAFKNSTFIPPALWGVLFDVSFDEILQTKAEADKYCRGKCFKYKGVWIPIKIKEISNGNN